MFIVSVSVIILTITHIERILFKLAVTSRVVHLYLRST